MLFKSPLVFCRLYCGVVLAIDYSKTLPLRKVTMITRQAQKNRGDAAQPEVQPEVPAQEQVQDTQQDHQQQDNETEQEHEDIKFALSPAQACTGLFDMSSSTGRKLHYKAVQPEPETEKCDCQPDGLKAHLDDSAEHALEHGWNDEIHGVMQIPKDPNEPTKDLTSVLTNCGEVTLEQIRKYEVTHICTSSRCAQDNFMLHERIMNSLTKAGKAKVRIWKKQHAVNGRVSGNLLLKVLIREGHLDTNATASQIRTQLSSLDTCISTVGSDILKFNEHVDHLIEGLAARGQKTTDLVVNLFKGHAEASDSSFAQCVARKQELYEEGDTADDDVCARELMNMASNKHKNLKLKGKWNAPSEQEEKILTLEAKVKSLQNKEKRNSGGGGGGKGKQKAESDSNPKDKKRRKKKPDWLENDTPPKHEHIHQTRQWNGRDCCWCIEETGGKCEGKWRTHLPSKCEGKDYLKRKHEQTKTQGNKSGGSHNKEKSKKRLKMDKALAATVSQSGDDSSESDNES